MMPNLGEFAQHSSGLFVPDELKREREVWTRDETKAVIKVLTLLESRGLVVFLGCPDERCRAAPIDRYRNMDGSITMRCAHKDRVLSRTI